MSFVSAQSIAARLLVKSVLEMIPRGSLLRLEYEPKDGVRPEVAAGARALGADPRTYIVEMTSFGESKRGEPILRGRALNRGNGFKTFALFSGTLTDIQVLRRGPAAV